MTVFIEGTVFPIGEKNVNGWGIPESEVENAINSLKSSVIRICSRDSPHGCDDSEDPNAEIGNIVDVWREGNVVKTRAAITDSIASQKISDGTWKNTWSMYGKAPTVVDGWPTDFSARSLTLVQNPAWENASWNMAANIGGIIGLRTFSEFTLIAFKESNEGEIITTDSEDKIKEPETQLPAATQTCEVRLKEMTVKLEEMTAKLDAMNTKSSVQASTIEENAASNEKLMKELEKQTGLAASLEQEKTGLLTREEAQTLVASAIEMHIEEQNRNESFSKLEAARKDLGLETIKDDFKVLTAAGLDRQTDEYRKIKLTNSGPPPSYLGSNASPTTTACTGAYDGKGEWKI